MTQEISLASSVRISDQVIFRDLEDEAVLLDLKTGTYFGLDAVGTRMWHLLREHGALQKVVDIMVAEYEVSPEACARDLKELIAALSDKGLVELA